MTSATKASDQRLAVTYRALTELKPDPRNARVHSRKHVEQIIASVGAFGFTNPVLADENGMIIGGHGRYLAAKAMGLSEIPVIVLRGLTDTQKRALRLADNKIALNSAWDVDLLRVELGELAALEIDFDVSVTGFSAGEIDVLLSESADPDDDAIPPVPAAPRTRPGDIWMLGEHRIGCGDARDQAFLSRVVGDGRRIDAAFVDLPYNVRISGHANARGRHREFAMASGEMTSAEFRGFLLQALKPCTALSRDGAVHFLCMDWRHMADLMSVGNEIYDELLNLCVWNKSNAGMGSLYRSKHELVFVYRVGKSQHFNSVELGKHGRNRTNVWDYASVNTFGGSRQADLALHPTVKPTTMVSDAFRDVTKRGDIVADVCLGSGTTLVAAERIGRRCRGLEIDPGYIDVALERWSAMTGMDPVLEGRTAA